MGPLAVCPIVALSETLVCASLAFINACSSFLDILARFPPNIYPTEAYSGCKFYLGASYLSLAGVNFEVTEPGVGF